MSIAHLVAKRFLTGKKEGFLSFIALVSLFGVCLGVASLTVVMGVMEGFESQLRSIITGTHSHIVLHSYRQGISDPDALREKIKNALEGDLVATSPYVFSEVMLAKGSRVMGSMLEGVEEGVLEATDLTRYLTQGTMPENGTSEKDPTIIVGAFLAESLGLKIGDELSIISPFFEKESLQPRARKFKLSGIVSTGMHEYDSKYSMIQANEARDFFQLPPSFASAMKIKTTDANRSEQLTRKLERELGASYRARDWTELNRNLLYAIKIQKAVIFVILTSIIVVAAFNIMSTLMMMMSEKKKEMSILKAMGLSPVKSASVFFRVGLVIGTTGALTGVALGLLLCLVLAKTRFIQLPPDVYFISYLPVDVQIPTLVLIAVSALLVAVAASLYPSYLVARESPVEGLRYE